MRDMGIIHGDKDAAKELVVGKTTVYVHRDIEEVETEEGTQYAYHEYQYDKDEYITMMSEQQSRTRADVDYIAAMTDVEL